MRSIYKGSTFTRSKRHSLLTNPPATKYSYKNRFTPRKASSIWSAINLRATIWWVMSAKQEATRQRRLKVLIESSAAGLKIPLLRR